MTRPIVVALPKGRILDEAAVVFARAGYDLAPVFGDSRKLVHDCGPLRVLVLRNSDIATYVAHGAADVGVAGSEQARPEKWRDSAANTRGSGQRNEPVRVRPQAKRPKRTPSPSR